MINNSVAMLRKLKEFFEQHMGLHSWNGVKVVHTGKTEEEEYEYVAIEFSCNGTRFRLEVIPPEDAPPLGRIELRGPGAAFVGAMTDDSYERIATALKSGAQ